MVNKNKAISVLALATALSGCASTQLRSTANHDTILPNETIEAILDASVKLDIEYAVAKDEETATVYSGVCSGTVLYDQQTKQNYVLTTEHCCPPEGLFEGKEVLTGYVSVGEFEAEVVKKNSDYDLALLKLNAKDLPYFKRKIAEKVEIGEIVAGASFPQNLFETLFKGHVAARDDETNGVSVNDVRAVFEGHIDKGSSGAGVYVFQGNKMFLAGVLQGSYDSDGLKGMAPVEHLRKFFKGTELEDEYL